MPSSPRIQAFCSLVSCSNVLPKLARAANSQAVISAQYVFPVPGGPYRIICPLRSSIAWIRAGIPVKRGGGGQGLGAGGLASYICFSASSRFLTFFIL